jgi:hypothetical protein
MHDPCICYYEFQLKKYFHYEELNYLLNQFIHDLPYSVRGLIFKSLHLKFKDYLINFDDDVIKTVKNVKYRHVAPYIENINDVVHVNTVIEDNVSLTKLTDFKNDENVFYCKKTSTPDVYELIDKNNQSYIACVPSIKVSKMLRDSMINCTLLEKIIVKCTWNNKFEKWMPIEIVK